jgi:two-component system, OmpR family, manganese sensing response regulator
MTSTRILIIDDDRELCEELSEILTAEGHLVSLAFDGVTGKALADRREHDILLLDLRLPGMSGLEILRSVGSARGGRVVLVISGSPLDSSLPKQEQADTAAEIRRLADRLIPKPFNVEELLETIREFSRR